MILARVLSVVQASVTADIARDWDYNIGTGVLTCATCNGRRKVTANADVDLAKPVFASMRRAV